MQMLKAFPQTVWMPIRVWPLSRTHAHDRTRYAGICCFMSAAFVWLLDGSALASATPPGDDGPKVIAHIAMSLVAAAVSFADFIERSFRGELSEARQGELDRLEHDEVEVLS